MFDIDSFNYSLDSIKSLIDIIAKIQINKKEPDKEINLIEFDKQILIVENAVLSLDIQKNEIEKERSEFEKKLTRYKNWEIEKENYEFVSPTIGFFVYSSKNGDGSSKPMHWLCSQCYENHTKSILQLVQSKPLIINIDDVRECNVWKCNICKFTIDLKPDVSPI